MIDHFKDWFIVDELGIWIYSVNMENILSETYDYLTYRVDMAAIDLCTSCIELDDYINTVITSVSIPHDTKKYIINMTFLSYEKTQNMTLAIIN